MLQLFKCLFKIFKKYIDENEKMAIAEIGKQIALLYQQIK